MGEMLVKNVRELLRALETSQRDLSLLQDRKRVALTQGNADDLLHIAREETVLSYRLRDLVQRRGQILDDARRLGVQDSNSLTEFVATLPAKERAELQPRIEESRQRSEHIRRETWVQWIVAHRAYSHYSSLLELIAQSGTKSPTYEEKPIKEGAGGALFDASA